MISKKVFYVWGANESKPEKVLKCMASWQKNLQDYEIVEINDESKEYFDFQEELKQNKLKLFMKEKCGLMLQTMLE